MNVKRGAVETSPSGLFIALPIHYFFERQQRHLLQNWLESSKLDVFVLNNIFVWREEERTHTHTHTKDNKNIY